MLTYKQVVKQTCYYTNMLSNNDVNTQTCYHVNMYFPNIDNTVYNKALKHFPQSETVNHEINSPIRVFEKSQIRQIDING